MSKIIIERLGERVGECMGGRACEWVSEGMNDLVGE